MSMAAPRIDPEHLARLDAGAACLAAALELRHQYGLCTLGGCDPHHVSESKDHIKSCKSPGKRPVGLWKHLQGRLTTPDEIRKYWRDNPTRNVGMVCGAVSGVFWLDTDGQLGLANFLRDSGLTELPSTVTSGNDEDPDSKHYGFRVPSGVRIKTTPVGDPTASHNGYSILGEGAYCVLPPSRHPKRGRYVWLPGLAPGQVDWADPPPELLAIARDDRHETNGRSEAGNDSTEGRMNLLPGETVDNYPPSHLLPILERCAFMAHCQADAATLSEPEWHSMISICAHCVDGAAEAHRLSAPYPNYSPGETDQKLATAKEPHRCDTIAGRTGGRYCRGCNVRDLITTPIELGRIEEAAPAKREGLTEHTIGAITLVPGSPRSMTSKITVPVTIKMMGVDARTIDVVNLTSTISGREKFVGIVRRYLANDLGEHQSAVQAATAGIVVEATEYLRKPRPKVESDKPTIGSIVGAEVRTWVDLKYITDGGRVYDLMSDRAITRAMFIERFTSNEIVGLAAVGADAPRDEQGTINRGQLVGMVERELKLLWGDLTSKLPDVGHAKLSKDSAAARDFRAAIVRTWTAFQLMSINKVRVFEDSEERESLQLQHKQTLSLIAQDARDFCRDKDDALAGSYKRRWQTTKPGLAAWWRFRVEDRSVVLAMRFELLAQMGVKPPEGCNERTFRKLGLAYGVFTDLSAKLSDKSGSRLAVLADDLADELLAEPAPDPDNSDDVFGPSDDKRPPSDNAQDATVRADEGGEL